MKRDCAMQMSVKLFFLLTVFIGITQAQQVNNPFPGILTSTVDENTVVRFYYEPLLRDHYIYPLVLRVGADDVDKMQSAPILTEGLTVCISLSEMKDLVAAIIKSVNMPIQTNHSEVLGAFEFLPEMREMDVVIIYSKGAARGSIAPKDICTKLSLLNSTVKSPRAKWQFELFRVHYACHVHDFDSLKY